jgi:predicted RNA-binding protein associated with RNAse of E/G family
LGYYLVSHGIISPEQLKQAIAEQRRLTGFGRRKRLGQILLDMGLVTEEQLQRALKNQEGDFFGRFQD